MFSRASSCQNARTLFASSVILASTLSDCRRQRADCRAHDNQHETADDENELFQGQCLKRQLYTPNVPYPAWDYNWDGRMTPNTTLESLSKNTTARVKGKTRHVILIRHGQYDETCKEDTKRKLTKLGRIQARLTGQRLQIMLQGMDNDKFGACNITSLTSSDMTRAKETAHIISQYIPNVPMNTPDVMLNEVLPAPIIPVRPEIDATAEIDEHAKTMDGVFHKYIYRSPQDDDEEEHEFEVIVCHGNVIRYLFCRALQIPPEAWLRMSIFNCSMTYLMIKPNGYCSCRMLGDIEHLGYEHSTFSGGHGFAWS